MKLPGTDQGPGLLQARAGVPKLLRLVVLAPAVVSPAACNPPWGPWPMHMADQSVECGRAAGTISCVNINETEFDKFYFSFQFGQPRGESRTI